MKDRPCALLLAACALAGCVKESPRCDNFDAFKATNVTEVVTQVLGTPKPGTVQRAIYVCGLYIFNPDNKPMKVDVFYGVTQ